MSSKQLLTSYFMLLLLWAGFAAQAQIKQVKNMKKEIEKKNRTVKFKVFHQNNLLRGSKLVGIHYMGGAQRLFGASYGMQILDYLQMETKLMHGLSTFPNGSIRATEWTVMGKYKLYDFDDYVTFYPFIGVSGSYRTIHGLKSPEHFKPIYFMGMLGLDININLPARFILNPYYEWRLIFNDKVKRPEGGTREYYMNFIGIAIKKSF